MNSIKLDRDVEIGFSKSSRKEKSRYLKALETRRSPNPSWGEITAPAAARAARTAES